MTWPTRGGTAWLSLVGAGMVLTAMVPELSSGPARFSSYTTAFEVGAASADATPPALDTAEGRALDAAEFVPACGASEAQIAALWPGKRLFAFTDPYRDLFGTGQYVPGDPYCDADHAGRYQAPYLGGGSGTNRWPTTSADPTTNGGLDLTNPVTGETATADPIDVHAVVFDVHGQRTALVTVDSIGIFDDTMQQIRAAVTRVDHNLTAPHIFISSTHDESAPDPIGLWGPGTSQDPLVGGIVNGELPAGLSSGVDNYYMGYLVQKAATAIEEADADVQPAELKVAMARMPSNVQSCWSSYPYVDADIMPVMQGVNASTGKVIFTLVNVSTHDETLGFSGNPAYEDMLSGDWAGQMSEDLENYYGGVGMEMAGLVGSVETPALYPPLSATGTPLPITNGVYQSSSTPEPDLLPRVPEVPGALHNVPGNPTNGCSSVYPEPAGATGRALEPVTDALEFIDVYAASVATEVAASLDSSASTVVPHTEEAQTHWMCLQLENNLFAAAFALDLFPGRTAYVDPECAVGASLGGSLAVGTGSEPATVHLPAAPLFIKTEVGVLTLGPIQIAYSPGEVFPFTELGGYLDASQMPFPTDCYLPDPSDPTDPAAADYTCGAQLPMTDMVSAEMTEPYRFLAGLGEDMLGYLFPPGNFVGTEGETLEAPWALYEDTTTAGQNGVDRFGYGHPDDPESVGPHAGLAVTQALSALLGADGHGDEVLPGLFVDASGHRCDSPFPADAVASGDAAGTWVTGCTGFSGAIGIEVVEPGGTRRVIDIGPAPGEATGWATYLGSADPGTPAASYVGTSGALQSAPYPYSTATRGVILPDGRVLLVDVFSGAGELGGLN